MAEIMKKTMVCPVRADSFSVFTGYSTAKKKSHKFLWFVGGFLSYWGMGPMRAWLVELSSDWRFAAFYLAVQCE